MSERQWISVQDELPVEGELVEAISINYLGCPSIYYSVFIRSRGWMNHNKIYYWRYFDEDTRLTMRILKEELKKKESDHVG
jgi:hypothetical protein